MYDLSERQLDALREISNIGAAHAATALSQMTQCATMIAVPAIKIVQLRTVSDLLDGADDQVVAVIMHMLGDLTGRIVFMMPEADARMLCDLLLGRQPAETATLDELERSSLQETANIVGGAYHPGRDTFFLVQDSAPSSPADNLVGEIDPATGNVINSFQVSPEYDVVFGDLDVCGATGNLLLVSSVEPRIGEFTPDGAFVAGHPLPGAVTSVSGIALDDASSEAWVSGTGGTLWRLNGVPCPVPEPSSTLMLVVGSAALLGLERRRRAREARPRVQRIP